MEEAEINYRIKSLILYIDSVERSDVPLELKREKLMELEREKLFLENILDDRKFKRFLKEFIIGMTVIIIAVTVLMFCVLFYGN
jgi:hypothetical protein